MTDETEQVETQPELTREQLCELARMRQTTILCGYTWDATPGTRNVWFDTMELRECHCDGSPPQTLPERFHVRCVIGPDGRIFCMDSGPVTLMKNGQAFIDGQMYRRTENGSVA